MDLFIPVLNQMIVLFIFIVIGYVLGKWKFVPENSSTVLSKLENMIFMPALVMGTFIKNCNLETVRALWKVLLSSCALLAVVIPLSFLFARLCFKENYLKKIVTYGLAFSNFGFMGNAVMSAVFPEIFFEYTVFTLPLWFMIYLWGAPVLLISEGGGEKQSMRERLKSFVNPMLIGMLIGLIIVLTGLGAIMPKAITSVVDGAGSCMSPIAMILTGMTIAKVPLLNLLSRWRIYVISVIKLLVYPLIFIGVLALIPANAFLTNTVLKCIMCVACMPMGLNTIVIPAAYGKDTTDAAGLALISHVLSVGTLPLMFMLFQWIIL